MRATEKMSPLSMNCVVACYQTHSYSNRYSTKISVKLSKFQYSFVRRRELMNYDDWLVVHHALSMCSECFKAGTLLYYMPLRAR